MYQPHHFQQHDPGEWYALVRAHPLATCITQGADGFPVADELPFLLDAQAPNGSCQLLGHVARANPLWHTHPAGTDVLLVFKGPQAYVSPSWYATKAAHGKVVPTWNYTVVQARGSLRVIDRNPAELRQLLERLTAAHEGYRPHPWQLSDAPEPYVSQLLQAVVGLEITVSHWTAKWKVSQNQPQPNRAGVVAGLAKEGTAHASALAPLIPG